MNEIKRRSFSAIRKFWELQEAGRSASLCFSEKGGLYCLYSSVLEHPELDGRGIPSQPLGSGDFAIMECLNGQVVRKIVLDPRI